MRKDDEGAVTACALFEDYIRSVTRIMNVLGVDAMVRMLRKNADDLEGNKALLEKTRRMPVGQA